MVQLGDVVTIDDGTPVDEPWTHELLTVRLHARGLVPSGKRPNRTTGGRKHFARREGQILVGRQNFHRQCVGVVTRELDGYVTSNAITALRPAKSTAHGFVELIMATPQMAAEADLVMSGTGQREISQRVLLTLPLVLPPLDEQRRIVDLIGALDDAIEAADLSISSTRSVTTAVRREVFSKALSTSEPVTAGEIFDMLLGRQKSARQSVGDHVIPYLRAANISSDGFSLDDLQTMNFSPSEQEKYCIRPGDVMLVEGGSLGQSSMWLGELDGPLGFDKHVIRLRAKDGQSIAEFALQWTRWAYESGAFDAQATGATIRALGFGRAKAMVVPRLTVSEQQIMVEPLRALDEALGAHLRTASSLRDLRSNLLTALLSGEHEIPESYDELMEV